MKLLIGLTILVAFIFWALCVVAGRADRDLPNWEENEKEGQQ